MSTLGTTSIDNYLYSIVEIKQRTVVARQNYRTLNVLWLSAYSTRGSVTGLAAFVCRYRESLSWKILREKQDYVG